MSQPADLTPETPWRTVKEAAARAKTGTRLIYREVQAGRLKAARVGGRRDLRFRDEWIDAWLDGSVLTPSERPATSRRRDVVERKQPVGFLMTTDESGRR